VSKSGCYSFLTFLHSFLLHRSPFCAVHDDQAIGAFDWRDVARASGLRGRCSG